MPVEAPNDYFWPRRFPTLELGAFSNIGRMKCLTILAASSGVILSRFRSGLKPDIALLGEIDRTR